MTFRNEYLKSLYWTGLSGNKKCYLPKKNWQREFDEQKKDTRFQKGA